MFTCSWYIKVEQQRAPQRADVTFTCNYVCDKSPRSVCRGRDCRTEQVGPLAASQSAENNGNDQTHTLKGANKRGLGSFSQLWIQVVTVK